MKVLAKTPFLLFFISGFCGLLYQVVWLRLAFRSFGVITPVLSVVISVFMLGLALGSWWGGKWISRVSERTRLSPIIYYALAELLIGVGAFVVPWLFSLSEGYLLSFGEMNSFAYLALSALLIAVNILPWCLLMGVTFPLMMAFLKGIDRTEKTSFSFLYLANVIGAMCGTLITAFVLIELLGFRNTLIIAGFANFTIAAISLLLGKAYPLKAQLPQEESEPVAGPGRGASKRPTLLMTILFTTGFVAMALEVVWTRAFTPVLETTVYAFAYLVSVYLLATWVGSFIYRRDISREKVRSNANLIGWLAVTVFAPIVINDPRINTTTLPLLASIFPVCAVLGYLTPKLIDTYSEGFPGRAGRAYAINIVGCILGPLVSSYLLLPLLGSKSSMVLLSVPFMFFFLIYWGSLGERPKARLVLACLTALLFLSSLLVNIGYEESFEGKNFARDGVIRRDHTATIVSYGEGMDKKLFVNGIGITNLTPIAKMMAHWPMAFLKEPPKKSLVICFGMGTTYRSLMSWPGEVTAVELVPSVKDAFGYYFEDADELLNDPRGKVIIDDGRRFLKRTTERFDVITIDPPPPIEAAGSSFLYSRDFYELVKLRLTKDGILHQWFPGFPHGEKAITEGVTRALVEAFPYVKASSSIGVGGWGLHYLASMSPIDVPTVETLAKRMPDSARLDVWEWTKPLKLERILERMHDNTIEAKTILNYLGTDNEYMVTDDRPVNEYFKLRRFFAEEDSE